MTKSEKIGLLAGATLVVAAILGTAYYFLRPALPTSNQEEAVYSPPAAAVKKLKKVRTPVRMVETYAPEAKAKLKLPPLVIADAQQQVTAATTVASNDHPQTVTSVLNTTTGVTTSYVKEEPLPWLSFNQRGQARVDTGYKLNRGSTVPQRASRLTVMHDFMQSKAVNFGALASIDTTGDAFVGVGLSVKW